MRRKSTFLTAGGGTSLFVILLSCLIYNRKTQSFMQHKHSPCKIIGLNELVRDALGKKNGIMWEKFPNRGGSSRPNPLLDVSLPSYFWHAKIILRYKNMFYIRGEVISDHFEHLKIFSFGEK